MRTKVVRAFCGKHLDYGSNDGHVTKRLFGNKDIDDLYVSDIEFKISEANRSIAKNFLYIDPVSSRIENEGSFFDSITCIHVIEHVSSVDCLMREMNRQLKVGGRLYLESPNSRSLFVPSLSNDKTWNFYDDPTHLRPYTTNALRNICLSHGFRIQKSGIYRELKYAAIFPIAPIISLILRDWRPVHYASIHLIGWSSFVLCEKV